jgi:hypothetical protein
MKMKNRFFYAVSVLNLLLFSFYLFSFTAHNKDVSDKILKVRGVVIVDSLGIERVIIGSHLPEPNFATGHRIKARGKTGSISGIMLYDAEGQERGGYVTDDYYGNIFLTLDSKTSQHFLMVAEPQGAAAIQLWSRDGKNKVSIFTDDDDADIELKKNNKPVKLYSDDN